MAGTNSGEPGFSSQEENYEEIRKEAKTLYERGLDLLDISATLGIPYELLNQWKFVEQWGLLPESIQATEEVVAPAIQESKDIAVATEEDLTLSTVEANQKLLSGYRLVQQVAQDAVLNDNLKFKDKKQASDAFIDSLKGEVAVLGIDLSPQFLLDIAQIIREEVKDEETLQRLGERLVAIGRLYNARITAQRN